MKAPGKGPSSELEGARPIRNVGLIVASILLALWNGGSVVMYAGASARPDAAGDENRVYAQIFVGVLWLLGDGFLLLLMVLLYTHRPRTCWRCGTVGRHDVCAACGADVRKAAPMMETLPAADIPESHAVPYEAGSTVERVTAHVDVPAMSHDQNETAEVSKEESKLSDRAEVDEARHSHRVASGISFAKAMVVFNLIALGILLVITVATFGVILLFFWPQFLGALVLGNVVVCLLFLGRRFRRRAGSP